MSLNPLNFPLVTQSPRFRSDVSAWVGRIAFGLARVQAEFAAYAVKAGEPHG